MVSEMLSERPILIPLIALSAGCILAYLLTISVSVFFPAIILTLLVAACLLNRRLPFWLMLALFWLCWGMAALSPRLDGSTLGAGITVFDGQQVVIEGLLLHRPVILPNGQRLTLKVERVFKDGLVFLIKDSVLVTIDSGQGTWISGDRIRFPAKLKVPRMLGLPGEFNYPRYLALQDIVATAWVKNADSIVLIRSEAKPSLFRWIDRVALKSHSFIKQTLPNPDQRSVVLALATGGQQEISPDLTTAYSRAGVSHILSVSGFHVGVVILVWIFLLRGLLLRWEWLALRFDLRRTVLLSVLPVMVVYLVFTGGAPATARSVLMLSAVVLAIWSEREVDTLDALLLAAFVLLLFDPGLLFDLSFQLSFLALLGLVVLTPFIMSPFERFLQHAWQRSLLTLCAASLAAILATIIPVLATFHQASFTGIAANLVVVPLLGYGATVLATTAIPLIFFLPAAAGILLKLAGLLVQLCNFFVVWIAGLPVLHSFSIGQTDLLAMVSLLACFCFVRPLRARILISMLVFTMLIIQHFSSGQPVDGKLRMMFLSVGQGDALLVSLPDGRTMLVDGGGYLRESSNDFGDRYLVPTLHNLNVKRIDIMVLTHSHPDHLGGLPAVAEKFPVGEFWHTADKGSGTDYQRLVWSLNRQKTLFRVLKQGDRPLLAGDIEFTVVSPLEHKQGTSAENDESLVIRLKRGSFSALLMADAGFEVENELIRQGMGPITLLKVGHHGSKTASSKVFLDRINPELAVISVGAGNSFGLPAAETVNRIRQHGIQLYRTDHHGSILVTNDVNGYTVSPLVAENRLISYVRRFVLTGSELLR